ncbi:MAG: two-component system response regulator [Paenibacillaceae bacterium]|jgi:two-component system response regulator YesN|nr:two-component system response regulator [Paenibacillaceae bacterium]
MWKVLLVEDEPFVRKKLRKLINWEEAGFSVCGEAGNGREALEQMKILAPDLVIADIAMPIMNGLDLLRSAREAGMESKFIMLTCMNEFEYARKALEYGASGYILKLSMGIPELQEALAKVGREMSSNMEQKELVLQKTLDRYYRELWEYIHGQEQASAPVLPERMSPFKHMLLVTVFTGRSSLSAEELIRQGIVSGEKRLWTGSYTREGLTTFFFWFTGAAAPAGEQMGALPARGLYSSPFAPGRLAGRWGEQLKQMAQVWYREEAGLLECRARNASPGSTSQQERAAFTPSWSEEREIIAAFELHNADRVKELLTAYWHSMAVQEAWFGTVRETAARLDRMFASLAGRGEAVSRLLDPEQTASHAALLSLLLERMEQLLAIRTRSDRKLTDHGEINRIIEYCHQHYGSPITLKAMSRMVAMEEHYLSRLFKQKTGEPLISYVQRLRLEKARELLAESRHTAAEIGRMTGFPSENYFTRSFRKRYGQAPGQYRRERQQSEDDSRGDG